MDFQKYYQQVARENGTTPEKVRESIQKSIERAWRRPDKSQAVLARQAQFPHQGDIPTPEEFIEFLSEELAQGGGAVFE